MKLSEILNEVRGLEFSEIEIEHLTHDSKEVTENGLYFAIVGTKVDGHDYAVEAQKNGAVAIVCSKKTKSNLPHIIVEDVRSALAKAASKFYGEPSKKLKMIAITGTNGKTTTSYILSSILNAAGKKVGVIGTTAVIIGSERHDASLTTPDPIELHAILKRMADAKVEYVVMEASAHALELKKLDGIVFDVAAFTNLSQDHLDFFCDLDEYFFAKSTLFTDKLSRFAVINSDDERGRTLQRKCKIPMLSYGAQNPSDVFAIDLKMSVNGLSYILNLNDDIAEVKFSIPGKFNMYNTLCAAAVAGSLGISMQHIIDGIRLLKKVDGRFNIINTSRCSIIIDFAHTDDGLKNVLTTAREICKGKLITVFGCGGDRDLSKRPIMGEVVSRFSDLTIVTSDNPRSESPAKIISDIMSGVPKERQENIISDPDRKSAILKAVECAGFGDIVLIAGKGAERFQEIKGIKEPYNDEDYVMRLIEEKRI